MSTVGYEFSFDHSDLADRPAAAAWVGWWLVDDEDDGTLYKSDGATWTQIAAGVSATGGGGVAADDVTVDSTTLVGVGTDAQAVLEELDNAIADHVADTTDAHAGTAITNAPAGAIAATTVQAAINELDTEKAALSHAHSGADITSGTVADARIDSALARDTEVAAAYIAKTLADANSVLYAVTDDTPAALAMGASTILARLAAGNIVAATPAELRTLLALVIGTNVQAWDADLDTYAGITPAANTQSLLGAANYAAMRTLLGLVVGTNVQAWDADLDSIAALTSAANKMPYSTGAQTWALADLSAFARTILDDADAATVRATIDVSQLALARSGQTWYFVPAGTLSTQAEVKNTLIASAIWLPKGVTVDRLGCEVTLQQATTNGRLGLWLDSGFGYPGALGVDGGSVDTASGTGNKEATVSYLVPASGLYWLGFVSQGGTTQPTMRSYSTSTPGAVGNVCTFTTAPSAVNTISPYSVTGISGSSLPNPFGTPPLANANISCPRVYVRLT